MRDNKAAKFLSHLQLPQIGLQPAPIIIRTQNVFKHLPQYSHSIERWLSIDFFFTTTVSWWREPNIKIMAWFLLQNLRFSSPEDRKFVRSTM